MATNHILKIAIAGSAVMLLSGGIALAVLFMPKKSAWADEYREFASTLGNDDPLRQSLSPMLADGELSIWEISGVLCGEAYGCRLNNFADVLLSPEAAEMFAQTVLVNLKHQRGFMSSAVRAPALVPTPAQAE
jgi:hypothetical protein